MSSCTQSTVIDREWKEYLGGPDRNHYSVLSQINQENVNQLEMAWIYNTLDTGEIQCNPIIVDGILYGMTAASQPFAINAATGTEKWRKSPENIDLLSTSRGLVYWEEGSDRRILYTNGEWLYCVEAESGEPILSFGHHGRTSLKEGLGFYSKEKMVLSNTPGTVYKDLIIMPLRVGEDDEAAMGHIQAFNIKTGALEWVFNTIPSPGEYGYDTWPSNAYKNLQVGGANNWAGMAIDREKGIVFVPTGSGAYDFYGKNRIGSNLFSNTLLALDAKSGKRIWHYQIIHHDIWDRDLPAPPNLVTLIKEGKKIEAVAQVTKHGFIFIFERATGDPIYPIVEESVPASDIPGEHAWPTQPYPTLPLPFARQTLTEDDLSPFAENRDELLDYLKQSGYTGMFSPLNEKGTLVFPGLSGGAEWGGAAVDPDGIMYLNSNEMARKIGLGPSVSREQLEGLTPGHQLYTLNCTPCHGKDLSGDKASGFPSLVGLDQIQNIETTKKIISKGRGMMPAFTKFSDEDLTNIVSYIFNEQTNMIDSLTHSHLDTLDLQMSYQINRYAKFLDDKGYPAIKPPWGTLNAIDLNTGEYLWKIPYGEYPELTEKGIPITGSESFGGPIVTAGNLIFIAGTKDRKFRAFDKFTGDLLWETVLPSAAFATPSTYEVNGKQYIVIACGGTKLGAPGGDSFIAFALPDNID
ncbi:MAG TPA: pyrroloquinoline quinone-dependent dehydrogenase [Anditalea sp.]|nr:pyrroloquinoline quinone-dependent dehydrogenase [Anditalea sp.]